MNISLQGTTSLPRKAWMRGGILAAGLVLSVAANASTVDPTWVNPNASTVVDIAGAAPGSLGVGHTDLQVDLLAPWTGPLVIPMIPNSLTDLQARNAATGEALTKEFFVVRIQNDFGVPLTLVTVTVAGLVPGYGDPQFTVSELHPSEGQLGPVTQTLLDTSVVFDVSFAVNEQTQGLKDGAGFNVSPFGGAWVEFFNNAFGVPLEQQDFTITIDAHQTIVPIPGAVWLFGSGLLGLLGLGRRRKVACPA